MQTNTLKKMVVILFLAITVIAFTSCQKEKQVQPPKTDQALPSNLLSADFSSAIAQARKSTLTAKIAQTDYVYLLGVEPLEGPDKSVASNGDTISIAGSGTLSIHEKSVSGSGWFQHTNAAGTLLASGTWNALELISFKSFGTPGPPFPPSFEAGKAEISIHLTPEGGGEGFDAILQVYCVLPGSKVPPAFDEGIRLFVPGVANFNVQVHGQTIFILQ